MWRAGRGVSAAAPCLSLPPSRGEVDGGRPLTFASSPRVELRSRSLSLELQRDGSEGNGAAFLRDGLVQSFGFKVKLFEVLNSQPLKQLFLLQVGRKLASVTQR